MKVLSCICEVLFFLRWLYLFLVRDLDFANDTAKSLSAINNKIADRTATRSDIGVLRKVLADTIYFVADVPDKGGDCLDILVEKPNREKQKLLREQNVLKQVINRTDI